MYFDATCATCIEFYCQNICLVFHYIENPSSPAPPSFAPSTGFSPAPSLSEDSTEFKKPNTTSGGTRRFHFLSYLLVTYCYLWKVQRYLCFFSIFFLKALIRLQRSKFINAFTAISVIFKEVNFYELNEIQFRGQVNMLTLIQIQIAPVSPWKLVLNEL